MNRQLDPNLAIVEMAAERLGELREETVFVGGCATGLLLTDPASPPVRATRDVDEIASANAALRAHLAKSIAFLLKDPDFHAALPGQLPSDAANQARLPIILARLRMIARLQEP